MTTAVGRQQDAAAQHRVVAQGGLVRAQQTVDQPAHQAPALRFHVHERVQHRLAEQAPGQPRILRAGPHPPGRPGRRSGRRPACRCGGPARGPGTEHAVGQVLQGEVALGRPRPGTSGRAGSTVGSGGTMVGMSFRGGAAGPLRVRPRAARSSRGSRNEQLPNPASQRSRARAIAAASTARSRQAKASSAKEKAVGSVSATQAARRAPDRPRLPGQDARRRTRSGSRASSRRVVRAAAHRVVQAGGELEGQAQVAGADDDLGHPLGRGEGAATRPPQRSLAPTRGKAPSGPAKRAAARPRPAAPPRRRRRPGTSTNTSRPPSPASARASSRRARKSPQPGPAAAAGTGVSRASTTTRSLVAASRPATASPWGSVRARATSAIVPGPHQHRQVPAVGWSPGTAPPPRRRSPGPRPER